MTRPECYPPVWYSELADLADGNGLGRVFAEGDENAFCDLTAAAAKLYGSLMGLTADEVQDTAAAGDIKAALGINVNSTDMTIGMNVRVLEAIEKRLQDTFQLFMPGTDFTAKMAKRPGLLMQLPLAVNAIEVFISQLCNRAPEDACLQLSADETLLDVDLQLVEDFGSLGKLNNAMQSFGINTAIALSQEVIGIPGLKADVLKSKPHQVIGLFPF